MIDYDVVDLLKILLRRWYIVILIAILFSVLSIPIAKESYDNAVQYYNEQMKSKEETVDENQDKIVSFCIMKVEAEKISELSDSEAANIVYQLLHNSCVKNIINTDMQENELSEDLLGGYSITLLGESNWILIDSMSLSGEEFCKVIDCFKRVLQNHLREIIGKEVNIKFGEISSQKFVQYNVVKQDDSFSELVLKEPSESTSYVKTFITSGLFGILVGILCVFILEYISENKRIERRR